ncbi:phage tail spike protein [Streptococcus suis]
MIYLKDGNIPLNLAYDDDIVQEANSSYQLSFKFPLTDGKWNLLKREVFLLADDLHGEQEFFIFEVKKAKGHVQVYAKQVATLLNYYSINSISVDRVPGQTVMTALAGSIKRNCPFTFFSDIMDRHTFNESNVSVMDALVKDKHSIVGQWGGDLVRDKYQVKLLKNGGIENESLFMYKKNLSSYEESENISGLKTRLHLKKVIKGQAEDEEDRVITVTVDSPLIGQYLQIYEADIEVNDQDVTDEASLLAYGQRYFGSTLCDLVENSINLDVKGKSDVAVKMFDTVSVFHERFDVDLRLKITSYHFGPMSKRVKSIGFGKVSQSFGSTVTSMVAGSVDKATEKLSASFERKLQREIDNANRHFDAEFEKRVEEINDGIEQSRAEAERHAEQIKTELSQEFDTFEHEYQATKQSQSQQIADILARAQANTILATDAKNIGNQAKADAANALSKAIQYKNEAIAEATRLDTVERQATETKLATAKSQAITEATRLVETAKSLLSGQISNISTDLSQTKEAIKLLATRETVDTLTGRVSSAEAMIQVQADQISQRVKTSDFDQAEQRISTAESSITQLGNRITTEISETVAKIPQHAGSRNYIKNSKLYDYVVTSVTTQDVRFFIVEDFWKNSRRFERNMVRVSFDVTFNPALPRDISTNVHFSSSPWYHPGGITFKGNTTRKQHFDLLFDLSSASETYFTDNIFIRFNNTFPLATNVKIEQMTLYLSELTELWTQATEDLVNDISSVRTIINQTAEGQEQLSMRLSETQGKVTTAETNIRQLVNDVSSKVSQTTFDNLKQTVDSQGTSISQNQSAIALKAEKTYVDGVKTTADSALSKANSNADSIRTTKAELEVTSDAVATKVSQSDFNAAEERLRNAETTINVQSGQIEQRLTSSQVESLVVGKGYATSTVVQNLVKETSDTFKKSISETKKLIPTNFDNTNLLSVSNLKNGWFDNEGILRLTTMYVSTDYIELDSNTSYIWQTWTKSSNWAGLVLFDSQKQYITGSYRSVTVDSYVKQTIESENAKYIVFSFDKSILDGAIKSKLEKGAIATEWVPAYQDLVSTTEFHEVADTVDSHKRTISEQGQSISQVIQTANGLVTKVSALDKSDNLFSFEKSTKGFWIDRNGSAIAGKTYSHSDFLKLASDGTYQLQVWNKSTDKKWIGYTKYTSDKSYISGSYSSFEIESNGYKLLSFTNFDGYLIISYGSYTTDNMTGLEIQFERGLVATAYKLSTLDFATQTQVNTLAGSWSVQNLNSSGDILSQANLSSAEFLLEAAKIHLKGKTLADEIKAIDGKFETLFVADGTFSKLKSTVISAKTITGEHILFDKAFFDKMLADEALFKTIYSKNAFLTAVQAVTLSASKIQGGVLEAVNSAMKMDLNNANITFNQNATINFNSANNALVRRKGTHTAFVHFNDVNSSSDGGVGSLYASIGVTSSGDGINSESSGRFAGLRAFRGARGLTHGATLDQLELYGDRVLLMDDFALNRGFMFRPAALSRDDFIDMNQLVTCVRALRDMWVHYKNSNGTLSDLLNNRSNSSVNASWENMHSFK